MARRKVRPLLAPDGSGVPVSVLEFVPSQWTGDCEYHRWVSWDEARTAWATENLPNGVASLPLQLVEYVPDQPWSEIAHTI